MEILVIVVIIAILVTISVVLLMGAQNKAAVNAYKTSMKSVQAGLELCTGSLGSMMSGKPGDSLCGGTERYPKLPVKCGNISFITDGSSFVTTDGSCSGCRVECTVEACEIFEDHAGDCF